MELNWFQRWRLTSSTYFTHPDQPDMIYVVAHPDEFYTWANKLGWDVFEMGCIQPLLWFFPSWSSRSITIPFKNSRSDLVKAGFIEHKN